MPFIYEVKKGPAAGEDEGQVIFSCCVNAYGKPPNCGPCGQCKYVDPNTKKRCDGETIQDAKYCPFHLKKVKHLVIATSRIPNAGVGLFAGTSLKVDPNNRGEPLFRRGDKITPYGGRITPTDLIEALYNYETKDGKKIMGTVPYGLEKSKNVITDAACIRRAGCYCNQAPKGTKPNGALRKNGIFALMDIYKGDEIYVNYGPEYWKTHNKELVETTTWVEPNPKYKKGKKGLMKLGPTSYLRDDEYVRKHIT